MAASLLAIAFVAPGASSQSSQKLPAEQTKQEKPAVPPVTTTIEVHAETRDHYLPESVTVGTLDGLPLVQAPLSAVVVSRELLNDQQARVLSDVVQNDASVGEDYAPVGYYGDYEIRGYPIELATGLEINGMTVAGEQDIPLEDKERVEILQGIAGVESGVTSAGGLFDFVTKRPAIIAAIDLATDHRGSAFGDVDLGRFFGARNQIGARVNLASERIATYVNDANGWRAMSGGAADWKINSAAILKTDFEYQHKVQRSVAGYQLLGGNTVPDLSLISPSTMLGDQPWSKPNTFDTYNAGARLDYNLPHEWKAFFAGSFSRSLIDDNVIWPYGCYYEPQCNTPGGPSPFFFAPDGTYDIYDYRNPGELRIDAEAEAIATGRIKTGAVMHELAAGAELFRRSVQMPGYYTVDNPASPDGVIQDGGVYTYIGSENIYQPNLLFPIESPAQAAGPQRLYEDNHQLAGIAQDRVQIPGHIQLLAAARFDRLHDHNYSLNATDPQNSPPILTDQLVTLPQYAITFNPVESLMLYGSYSVMLSLGPQAPFWADNGNQFLNPYRTRDAEVGAKYQPGNRILLSAAVFHMRAPFFYPRVIQTPDTFCPANLFYGPGDLCFESQGHETHNGVEFSAQGNAANWMHLTASVATIHAVSSDTGTPAFDNQQVINVPRVRTALFADVLVPHGRGLHIMPGWSYTASKYATRDDAVSVSGYNLFNLGASYTPGGENGHMTVHLYADNITDKRYWKDTGASYGDTFIHLGAPTTVRLGTHYTF